MLSPALTSLFARSRLLHRGCGSAIAVAGINLRHVVSGFVLRAVGGELPGQRDAHHSDPAGQRIPSHCPTMGVLRDMLTSANSGLPSDVELPDTRLGRRRRVGSAGTVLRYGDAVPNRSVCLPKRLETLERAAATDGTAIRFPAPLAP